jgi:hypothetical protein
MFVKPVKRRFESYWQEYCEAQDVMNSKIQTPLTYSSPQASIPAPSPLSSPKASSPAVAEPVEPCPLPQVPIEMQVGNGSDIQDRHNVAKPDTVVQQEAE